MRVVYLTKPVNFLGAFLSALFPPFHVALNLCGQSCLVVGAGPVATRKAASLLECGARVTVVAPELCEAMQALAATHLPPELSVEQRTYAACDLAGMRVVITATGVGEVDLAVARDAETARVLVNAADEPEGCAFVLPAVLRTGPVSVAVSTGGVSPYLAGWIRSRIGAALGPEIGELASLVGAARSAIRARSVATEGLAWDEFVEVLWALVRSGDSEAANKEVDAFVASSTRNS